MDTNTAHPTHKVRPTSPMAADGLTPVEAHELVVDLEHAGIPPEAIEVVGAEATTNADMAAADGLAASRALRRVVAGALTGASIGVVLAVLVDLTTDVARLGQYLGLVIVGAVLGGLAGLYRRLTLQHDPAAADLPGPKRVSVNNAMVSPADAAAAQHIVADAATTSS